MPEIKAEFVKLMCKPELYVIKGKENTTNLGDMR